LESIFFVNVYQYIPTLIFDTKEEYAFKPKFLYFTAAKLTLYDKPAECSFERPKLDFWNFIGC